MSEILRASVGVNYWATGSKLQGSLPCRDNMFCHLFSERIQTASEGNPACWPVRDVGFAFGVKETEA